MRRRYKSHGTHFPLHPAFAGFHPGLLTALHGAWAPAALRRLGDLSYCGGRAFARVFLLPDIWSRPGSEPGD